ncbi:MAG TPA: hypothetical protein VNS52_00555, partial [Gemmatimonadaceae bacterium]|nr:hypothetical protein [Gemmatimonadaceae bacterium]
MKAASHSVLLWVVCALVSGYAPLHAQRAASVGRIMAGIHGAGRNGGEPYVTAGDRTYLIGAQDGSFPDMGGHVPGEMGGLWLHPIKLIDGFQATVTDAASGRDAVLSRSADFVTYPYGSRFVYAPVLDGVSVERFQFSPDGQDGLVVQYRFTNASARARRLRFRFAVKTDLLPVWSSEQLGLRDAPDSVAWRAADGIFVAHDTRNPWVCVWGAVPPAAAARRVADPPPLPTRGTG